MKPKLYIETSVVSYLAGRPSSNTIVAGHQVATQDLWVVLADKFEPYISDLVLQEVSQGDSNQARVRIDAIKGFPVLNVDGVVEKIAGLLLVKKAVPIQYPDDAVHIAVASVNGMDLIATWNFKHINNPVMRQRLRALLLEAGFTLPEICSPDELLEVDDE